MKPRSTANSGSLAGSRIGVLLPVVLAVAAVAWVSSGNRGCRTLAMAGRAPVGAGIRCRPTLRLGLRVDRARHPCADRPTEAIGGGEVLPLPTKPHVRRLDSGLDRALDHVRPSRSGGDRSRGSSRARGASVRGLLRRADVAKEVWGGLRRILPKCPALLAACPRLE